ncbi:hypothetical protein Fleli_3373 [Bernardetia litoralis DSM 6794]|uniref:Uncharacterized protein n=1 Tax=Bernardetia litoralis (strain ATCC 23117 / DSM 6794 / NBRC 15988 / NCIMB 1366 / Fx l1 / Sio-4) TaxID=880071 RepID=I4AP12_BERLS|nr:hypothetical protein [Bernardetia litoralis]AFM05697.1 hypothetical protein Fleli_3373 [Bernardetia litoralis DSM 6794]
MKYLLFSTLIYLFSVTVCKSEISTNYTDTVLYKRSFIDTVVYVRFDSLGILSENSKNRVQNLFQKVRINGWKYDYISISMIYNEKYENGNIYIPLTAAKFVQEYIEKLFPYSKYQTIYIQMKNPKSMNVKHFIAEIRLHSPP